MLPPGQYSGIAGSGDCLYLLPSRLVGGEVLVMNVSTQTFTARPLPQWPNQDEQRYSWDEVVITGGKLIAFSQFPEWALIMRLHDSSFGQIQTPKESRHWVALDDRLYSTPVKSSTIFVLDTSSAVIATQLIVEGFVPESGEYKWSSGAVWGRKIFYAPAEADCILVLAVDTFNFECISIENANPSGRSYWSISAASGKLYLSPWEAAHVLAVTVEPTCQGSSSNQEDVCKQRQDFYHMNRTTKLCEANVCKCDNGQALEPCREHGAEACSSCKDEFKLEGNQCEENILQRFKNLVLHKSSLDAQLASQALMPHERQQVERHLRAVVKQRNGLLLRTYQEQPSNESFHAVGPVTFLAVGLTGTGKSELCYWMTDEREKCSPSNTMVSHTSQATVVEGPAFGDKFLHPLIRWIDTPGRGDTRGEGADEALWKTVMHLLRARIGKVDAIVWVLNAANQRGVVELEFMLLKELRRSFGSGLYGRLFLVMNFLPHTSANRSHYLETVLLPQRQKFLAWIMDMEDKMFDWPRELRGKVHDQVNQVGIFGVSLRPEYYRQKPHGLPLSAPYLDLFPPFSHPAGIEQLINLFRHVRALAENGPAALLDNPHPRIGPGLLQSTEGICNCCGFVDNDGGRLVPGQTGVLVKVVGNLFSPNDRAVLIPGLAECGDPAGKDWPASWQKQMRSPQNLSAGSDLAQFDLPVAPDAAGTRHRLCFCEAPSCNASWRFGQDGGLVSTTDLTSCPSPYYRIYPFAFGLRVNRTRFVQVGSQLLGWTSNGAVDHSDTFPVLDLKSERMWGIKDLESNTTGPVGNSSMLPPGQYSGIAGSGDCLYLLPSRLAGGEVLVMNVSTQTFTARPLPQWPNQDEQRYSWDEVVITGGKLIAFSQFPEWALIMRLHDSSFGQIQTPKESRHWVALDDRLYSTPDSLCMISVFNTSTERFEDPFLIAEYDFVPKFSQSIQWSSGAVSGGKIFYAPAAADCILVLAVDSGRLESLECISIEKANPSERSYWNILAAGGKLYLSPWEAAHVLAVTVEPTCQGSSNQEDVCKQRQDFYHMNRTTKLCEANECKCDNGQALEPCREHDAEVCSSCKDEFKLEGGRCSFKQLGGWWTA